MNVSISWTFSVLGIIALLWCLCLLGYQVFAQNLHPNPSAYDIAAKCISRDRRDHQSCFSRDWATLIAPKLKNGACMLELRGRRNIGGRRRRCCASDCHGKKGGTPRREKKVSIEFKPCRVSRTGAILHRCSFCKSPHKFLSLEIGMKL